MVTITDFFTGDPSQLVYGFMLPTLLVFAIVWGAFSLFKLFDKKINFIIALIITAFVISTPQFASFATFISQATGYTALVVFFVIFLYGLITYSYGKGREFHLKYGKPSKKLYEINKEIEKLYDKMREARERDDYAKVEAIDQTIEKLKRERDLVKREISRRY